MAKEYALVSVRCSDSAQTLHRPHPNLAVVEDEKRRWEAISGDHYEHHIVEREVGEWTPVEPVARPAGLRLVEAVK